MLAVLPTLAVCVLFTPGAISQPPDLTLGPKHSVEVRGLTDPQLDVFRKSRPDWPTLFTVRVDQPDASALPALVGSYFVEADRLRFEPRFGLDPGLRYVASFDPRALLGPGSPDPITLAIEIPKPPAGPPTSIRLVTPTSQRLPENLLKIYLHFTAPMARGEVYQRVHILNDNKQAIAVPFLELGEELWDPTGTRVTILFDPGRIKRGLKPREQSGPVLESGMSYTLVVDAAWPDTHGQPLREGYHRTFQVGPADVVSPDPKTWAIDAPDSATRDPLQLRFAEALDHALLAWTIAIKDGQGRVVPGTSEVAADGRSWKFIPSEPWRSGMYRLSVDTTLEDLAGNSVGRTFEVDELRPVAEHIEIKVVERIFPID